jgi:purine nucleosidase/pyrimidine-specific ribonucleoside hydrolase
MKAQNIIIDTDLGDDVDDILALAFALLRPELCVKAITTVSYDTGKRCHLVARLLSCMERNDIAFAPGVRLPLRPATEAEYRNAVQPTGYILNQYGAARDADKSLADKAASHNDDAIELIARTVQQNAGDITLVCIGPLTNVAVALCRYPQIASQVCAIALMGGELHLNRREHNIAWDAHAAQIVFSSGAPLFVGTWDVTRRFVLSPDDCANIKRKGSVLCQLLGECIDLWWPFKAHKPSPVMYDIAPILWSYAPGHFTTQPMQVLIETRGEHTQGMTVGGSGAPNAQVTTDMRAENIRELYLSTLGIPHS